MDLCSCDEMPQISNRLAILEIAFELIYGVVKYQEEYPYEVALNQKNYNILTSVTLTLHLCATNYKDMSL